MRVVSVVTALAERLQILPLAVFRDVVEVRDGQNNFASRFRVGLAILRAAHLTLAARLGPNLRGYFRPVGGIPELVLGPNR